ncbi:MAG TPA: protein translocase SEC61 complex subunit gamma [Candidatus Nanopusillus sp.]|nr:protein translocase SEC61 complex subunit gamma [Candidatus Nanopusillus sp.]HIP90177.1 protein translocase SEC61 complex subunit gamma [Candidatus Nanopusillus sp.]
MIDQIKKLIDELYSVWKIARKPTWEETKQMVIITLLISMVVGFIGLVIFILIEYLL